MIILQIPSPRVMAFDLLQSPRTEGFHAAAGGSHINNEHRKTVTNQTITTPCIIHTKSEKFLSAEGKIRR